MDHNDFERRGLFDGLRVPFELNMLLLALACVVGFHWVVKFLEWFMDAPELLLRMVAELGVPSVYAGDGGGLSAANWFLTAVVGLGFWGFFATAINRIAAMKIAREETIAVRDACRFALRKFIPVVSSVLFVGVIFFVFYVCVNATIFGWLGRIPYVGELIIGPLYFLVLLFTFFVVFSVVLGVFGFNLASSAIATESSDTWDGISRSWNYILVRPWTVLLVFGLTFAYITVFSIAAAKFMSLSIDSLAIGDWGMGDRTHLLKEKGRDLEGGLRNVIYRRKFAEAGIDWDPKSEEAAKKHNELKSKFDSDDFWIALPSKVEFIEGYADGEHSWNRVEIFPRRGKEELERFEGDYGDEGFTETTEIANAGGGNVAGLIPTTLKIGAFLIWCWRWLCTYLMAAYALQYFLGANTMLYFLLRRDVEGEDYTDIVVEEEEADDEAAWSVAEPRATPTSGAPGQLIMPASAPGGPAAKAPDRADSEKSPESGPKEAGGASDDAGDADGDSSKKKNG